MRQATLLFPIEKMGDKVVKICLGMKKMGFGTGKWNGAGGKVEAGETVEAAAIRETKEEFGLEAVSVKKMGVLEFRFANNPAWDQEVHIYCSEEWKGELRESDEMAPKWFAVENIPYENMWSDDIYWLPRVLKGEVIQASFVFGEGDAILEKQVVSA